MRNVTEVDDDTLKSGQRAFFVWLVMMGALASCFLLYVLAFGRGDLDWASRADPDASMQFAARDHPRSSEIRSELRPFINAPLIQGPTMLGADCAPTPVVELRCRRPARARPANP